MRTSSRISVTSTLQLKLEGGISVTERLYLNRLEDGYRTTFAATVSAIDDTRVVLDQVCSTRWAEANTGTQEPLKVPTVR